MPKFDVKFGTTWKQKIRNWFLNSIKNLKLYSNDHVISIFVFKIENKFQIYTFINQKSQN